MRLTTGLITLATFAIAAVLAVLAARVAVRELETRSVDAVAVALADQGNGWASVLGDGLQVIIEGQAPSEAQRFRAISVAGSIVDASRVIDNMQVAPSQALAAPEFSIEILRGESGVSLIGLIPATTDRAALIAEIERSTDEDTVSDLLDVGDYPIPEGWRRSVAYAVRALGTLEHAKISVTAGHVSVTGISDSAEQQASFEQALGRNLPEDVTVDLSISAPRPVITPFALRFILDDNGARFETCAAETDAGRAAILAAARPLGLPASVTCTLGLGAPSGDWGAAAAMAIAAVGELSGGTLTFADGDVSLIALPGTEQTQFDRVVGALQNSLPPLFVLDAQLPSASEADAGPPQFTATRSPEGDVQLRGRIESDLMNDTAGDFARARFSNSEVTMGTRVVDNLPQGWSVRVLAGIEALSMLSSGVVVVGPDRISVRGKTGNADASGAVTRLLIDKLGPATELDVAVEYVEALDPIAGLPTPEECVAHITAVTGERKILFDPGSATLTAESQALVDDIAEVLRSCPDLPIEIAGYTDSQGRDEMNLELSQDRADAVLTALRARRVPVSAFNAIGHGEEGAIADNDTEAGREANRRIEFSLRQPEPVPEEPTALEEIEAETAADPADAATTQDEADDAAPPAGAAPADGGDSAGSGD